MAKEEPHIERPLSTSQVATLLGLSTKTVIRLAESGELPSYRVGDLWKFKRSEVEAYFDSMRYKPKDEPAVA